MSATTWFIIAIVGFSLSGVALVAAIFIFIKMNIPAVIGDLSGKTLAREIKAMRDANAAGHGQIHRSSPVNMERGKLTEKVQDDDAVSKAKAAAHTSKRLDKSTRLKKGETGSLGKKKGTGTESLTSHMGEVNIEERQGTAILQQNQAPAERQTEVLSQTQPRQTEVLTQQPEPQSRQTEVLTQPTRQTEVLTQQPVQQSRQTEVLSSAAAEPARQGGTTLLSEAEEQSQVIVKPVAFKVTRSFVEIHTDEVI